MMLSSGVLPSALGFLKHIVPYHVVLMYLSTCLFSAFPRVQGPVYFGSRRATGPVLCVVGAH